MHGNSPRSAPPVPHPQKPRAATFGPRRRKQIADGLAHLSEEFGLTPPLVGPPVPDRARSYIKAFQAKFGLPSKDGRLDGKTRRVLRNRAETRALRTINNKATLPDTSLSNEHQKFVYYRSVINSFLDTFGDGGRAAQVKASLVNGERLILGLRSPTNTRARKNRGAYDDRIVVLWLDENGEGHAKEFEGNTDPSAQYEDGIGDPEKTTKKDADLDGKGDLGRVPEGIYRFKRAQSGKRGKFLRAAEDITLERDTNHDGVFDDRDPLTNKPRRRENALNSGRTILFHAGGDANTWSAGCQTMRHSVFRMFRAAIHGGSNTEYWYVLLETKRCRDRPLKPTPYPQDDEDDGAD